MQGKTSRAAGIRGIHHVALTTDDLALTLDFYVEVLGFRVVRAMRLPAGMGTGPGNIGNPPFEQIRYYFLAADDDSAVSFFEIPKAAKPRSDRNAIGGMQQIAFAASPGMFETIQARLKNRDVAIIGPKEILPGLFTINFFDPHGVRVEVLTRPADGDEQQVLGSLHQKREDMLSELTSLVGAERAAAYLEQSR